MVDTIELYILVPVWMIVAFIQCHSFVRKKKLVHSFSCKFLTSIWMKFSMLPWPVGVVKFMHSYFVQSILKGENSAYGDLIKYTFGLCLDALFFHNFFQIWYDD